MQLIDNLFPQHSVEAAIKLLKVRRDLEKSIPSCLQEIGFIRLRKDQNPFTVFIDYRINVFLCYRKSDLSANTTKSKEAKQKLINALYKMYQYNPNYRLIYGYLIGGNSPSDIIFNNMTINVLSGESLLRYLFGESLPSILNNMQNKVNEIFEPENQTENHTSEVGCNSCINDNNMSMNL